MPGKMLVMMPSAYTGKIKVKITKINNYHAEKELMAISPSGMDYSEITPEDVVVMNLK